MLEENRIFINQVGYLPGSTKYFITTCNVNKFQITNNSMENVFTGDVALWKQKDKATGETLYKGDFSDLKESGEYTITLDNSKKSYPFKICTDIYQDVLYKTLKSFYFQRCGTPLLKEYSGEFSREACHTGLTEYHPSIGISGYKDVSGGWHNAGDYGKYITPAATAVVKLLIGYEHYPEKFNFSTIGLPEDGNSRSDFINEIRYELEWMFKMQELDIHNPMYGGVHYMVNSNEYSWKIPAEDRNKQYIVDYSSVSTADFAAAMACASRVFRDIDKAFSVKALNRAIIAWEFLKKHGEYPKGGFRRPEDMKTGGYAEEVELNIYKEFDMLWPAVELFLTTGKEEFHSVCRKLFKDRKRFTGGMTWLDKSGFPEIQYAAATSGFVDESLQHEVRTRLFAMCDHYLSIMESDGFNTLLQEYEYQWGSNSEILNRGLQLIIGYRLSDEDKYKEAALYQLNYILGLNIHSKSFITGIGSDYPLNVHNACLVNDNIDRSYPGLLVGGPNRNVQIQVSMFDKPLYDAHPPGSLGAKCYLDNAYSFSSNENCITYTASIVPVAAFFTLVKPV